MKIKRLSWFKGGPVQGGIRGTQKRGIEDKGVRLEEEEEQDQEETASVKSIILRNM